MPPPLTPDEIARLSAYVSGQPQVQLAAPTGMDTNVQLPYTAPTPEAAPIAQQLGLAQLGNTPQGAPVNLTPSVDAASEQAAKDIAARNAAQQAGQEQQQIDPNALPAKPFPAQVIPGGMRPDTQKQAGPNVNPALLAEQEQHMAAQPGLDIAAMASPEAKARQGAQEWANTVYQNQVDAINEARQAREDRRVADVNQRMADIDYKTQELLDSKINPNQWIDSKSTGAKIGLAIGAALSGFGTGFAGQQNTAYNVIQNMIRSDLDAQVAQVNAKHGALALARTNLGQFMQLGMTQEQAKRAAELTSLQKVQQDLQHQVQTKFGGAAPEEAKALMNKLQTDVGQKRLELEKSFAGTYEDVQKYQKPQVVGGGGAGGAAFNRQFVGGIGYVPPNVAQEMTKASGALYGLADDIKALRGLYKEYGFMERLKDSPFAPQMQSAVGQAIKTRMAGMVGKVSSVIGNSGIVNAGEYPRILTQIGPSGLFADDPTKQLDTLDDMVRQSFKGLKIASGAVQGNPELGVSATGAPQERAAITGRFTHSPILVKPVQPNGKK